jgi:hypothetical protein
VQRRQADAGVTRDCPFPGVESSDHEPPSPAPVVAAVEVRSRRIRVSTDKAHPVGFTIADPGVDEIIAPGASIEAVLEARRSAPNARRRRRRARLIARRWGTCAWRHCGRRSATEPALDDVPRSCAVIVVAPPGRKGGAVGPVHNVRRALGPGTAVGRRIVTTMGETLLAELAAT